ncbi:MAG: DUF3160 domain-containing protein [Kofleriaceae bacterium]
MRSLVVLLVAGCSSRTAPPAGPPATVPLDPASMVAADSVMAAPAPPDDDSNIAALDDPGEWTRHSCHKTVWPSYDADYSDDDKPVEPEPPYVCEEGCAGAQTLDSKLAAINKARANEGVCDTRHRDGLEAGILRAGAPNPDGTNLKAWDRKTPLEHRDRVRSVLALTATEEQVLAQHGFVVPERLHYTDYTTAYYDIHRGELPVYVSADSILHAVYASNDQLIASLERDKLTAQLDRALGAMHCGLAIAAKDFPADIANDVDLYLTVARTLLANERVPSELGKVDKAVGPIVDAIRGSSRLGELDIFGRLRSFDATQYMPRGHYAGDDTLERYFRTAMWLSRTEFNLVSRDTRSSTPGFQPDPRETPREAVVALALADLAQRTGATANIAALDKTWTAFAGRREDVPFAALTALRAKAGIKRLTEANVAERLHDAIGNGYPRTVNVHPSPNVDHLAAIATLLGPRITNDMTALRTLVEERGQLHQPVELGFMLGHDRAAAFINSSEPTLQARLAQSRDRLLHAPVGDDLYSNWLDAIRALSHRPQGALPSFMDTTAFQDLRLDSAIAAYGQLRHNHVLIAAQMYDVGGCEIPDGYVEPALETYKQLAEYARRGRTTFQAIDPRDETSGAAYFARLERLMNVLVALSRKELANKPLSNEAKRFLSMIVEMREASGRLGYDSEVPVATYDGWYIDLFPKQDVSFKDASFMADYATFHHEDASGVHYIGAKGPRLGVFVVDTGGKPRMMVGPVANAFQHTGPLAKRLQDSDAATVAGTAPWAKSYTVAAPKQPAITVELQRREREAEPRYRMQGRHTKTPDILKPHVVRIDSDEDVGFVTVELLDHHFQAMGSFRVKVLKGRIETPIQIATKRRIEGLRLITGEFTGRLDLDVEGHGFARFGGGTGKPADQVETVERGSRIVPP